MLTESMKDSVLQLKQPQKFVCCAIRMLSSSAVLHFVLGTDNLFMTPVVVACQAPVFSNLQGN